MAQIRRIANPSDDHARAMLQAEPHGQSRPRSDVNVVPLRGKLSPDLENPLGLSAFGLFLAVDGDEHGDPGEKLAGSPDDVEMTCCSRVKAARIDSMHPSAAFPG
jgi:hypothetical protein